MEENIEHEINIRELSLDDKSLNKKEKQQLEYEICQLILQD
jgi:hypothetical protein